MRAIVVALAVFTACSADLKPFPLNETIALAQRAAYAQPKPQPTGVNTELYLEVIKDVVRHFRQFQSKNKSSSDYGKIIDPYTQMEMQYSTPTFAFAGATLLEYGVINGSDAAGFKQDVIIAMTAALEALVFGQPKGDQGCAQGHCNFYTMPLMLAIQSFNGSVPDDIFQHWCQLAKSIVPTRAYREWPHAVGNWAIVALTGEYIRYTLGLRDGIDDIVEQLRFQFNPAVWTDNGEYQDHTGCDGSCSPMPYDHFPRKYISVMLAYGYQAENASMYEELNRRGAWTSLLLQSPWGELPTGGRSSQHQWNEAVSCVTYEYWASKLKAEGDMQGAAAFKRAAGLSLKSLQRWQRPTGEFWVLKNRFDPALRYGYETYTYYSQYNLLPASMLATALKFADDSIPEGASFAETGGFVFTPQDLNKVIGNAGGFYVESELFPDAPPHDVAGLTRIHARAADPLISITAGAPIQLEGYPASPGGLTLGPSWHYTKTVVEHADIVSQTPSYDPKRFNVANILWSDNPTDVQDKLWLLPDNATNSSFVLDLYKPRDITGLAIRNSHNNNYDDRGVENFIVSLADNANGPWMLALEATLPDVRGMKYIPWSNYSFAPATHRYIKFDVVSYYGTGGALNSFAVIGAGSKSYQVMDHKAAATVTYTNVVQTELIPNEHVTPNKVMYGINYQFNESGVEYVSETYTITPSALEYECEVTTSGTTVNTTQINVPVFLFDGMRNTTHKLSQDGTTVTVELEGDTTSQLGKTCVSYQLPSPQRWTYNDAVYRARNGYMASYFCQQPVEHGTTWKVKVIPGCHR